jgi:alcohol dehydrogenase
MTVNFNIYGPNNITYGRGTAAQIGSFATDYGERALVITDEGIVAADLTDTIVDSLQEAGMKTGISTAVESDPTIQTVQSCLDAARSHEPSLLVGVGGGSVLDVTKAVSAAMTHPESSLRDLIGRQTLDRDPLATFLLPTTAGTGSEVSNTSALNDDKRDEHKVAIMDDRLFATRAIIDPDLSMSLPPRLTAMSGLDAFSHALGAVISTESNPFAEALCLRALSLIDSNIRAATFRGSSAPTARGSMALAAMLAMYGRVNGGRSTIHPVAHAVQAVYGLAHGEAIALVLPDVLTYNLPAATETLAGVATRLYDATGSARSRAECLVQEVRRLRADVGLDGISDDISPTSEELTELAARTVGSERHVRANPRQLTEENARALLAELL